MEPPHVYDEQYLEEEEEEEEEERLGRARLMSVESAQACEDTPSSMNIEEVSAAAGMQAKEHEEALAGEEDGRRGADGGADGGVDTSSGPGGSSSDEEDDEEDEGLGQLEMLARRLEAMREAGELPPHLADPEGPTRPPLLTFDVQGVAEFILGSSEADIVILGGAGMSTAAGIPDFRSPGTGLYDNLQRWNLPRPQAVFEIDYFKDHPSAFYELVAELWPGRKYRPTITHHFIRLLEHKGRLLRCFTQNIDSLESHAGVPAERVIAAHGNFDSATCLETGLPVPVDEVREAVINGKWRELREKHGGLVKPDIVFFGEPLPPRFFENAQSDLPKCRLCLVVGTSLAVQPFASLVNHVSDDCVRVLVNRDPVGVRDPRIPEVIAHQLGLGGFEFNSGSNYRDVALLGDCDSRIRELAEALGWLDELNDLIAAFDADLASRSSREGAASEPTIPLSPNCGKSSSASDLLSDLRVSPQPRPEQHNVNMPPMPPL